MSDPPSSKSAISLSPGNRLGPYEIVELLGVGGMGEVYRAHDPRLGRDVALKILRRSHITAEEVARFGREARAAGGLNHPNIVAVFDVGTAGDIHYVVSEVLEGETLRARLDRGMLPYRKGVEYGIQIAQALDAAHARGIWHRDVKPANAFITTDGRVKLLDFGIAKLTERDAHAASQDSTTEDTRAGEIRGTAGYMSPEQVRGTGVDHRTDIFSFGAVLYEMLTGVRAFDRPSAIQTMSAVLQDDPPDPVTINPQLPLAAAAIVRRCLEKNKEERFQSARDLAFDLQQLHDLSGVSNVLGLRASSRRRRALPLLLLAAAAVAGGVALAMLLARPQSLPSFEQLTFRRSRIGGARFASAAQTVIYSEAREGTRLDVWRIHLADGPASGTLDYAGGGDILATRTGELALSTGRRFVLGERFVGTLAVAPIGGGSPREVAENIEVADWDPAGKQLAVAHSTGDAGGHTQIEYPLGTPLYKTEGSIRFLRFSPDGQSLAFVQDDRRRGVSGHVAVMDLKGTVTPLTEQWESVRGLAWSPNGKEIWFTAGTARSSRSLRAVTLDKKQRVMFEAPGSLTVWDSAPDGRVLLSRDDERRGVVGLAPGSTVERDLSWSDDSGVADLSQDGRLLLGRDRFGVFVRATDGAPPTFLGVRDVFADSLSPDGKTALGTNLKDQLVRIPIGVGEPQALPSHGVSRHQGAYWFPDGRRILVTGAEPDRDLRSYIQDIDGGPRRPVTAEGTWGLAISPDGERIAAIGGSEISLWSVTGQLLQRIKGSQPADRPVAWSDDGRFLWIFQRGEVPARIYQLDLTTGQRRLWKTLVPPDTAGVYSIIEFEITPSGNAYVYSYTQLLSNLYVVRGLK